MNALWAGIGLATLLAVTPMTSFGAEDLATDAEGCGGICHVPMAWSGGESAMAWEGLGPRQGGLEAMKRRLGILEEQSQAWEAFQKLVLATRDMRPIPPFHQEGLLPLPQEEVSQRAWETFWQHQLEVKQGFRDLFNVLTPPQQAIAGRVSSLCEHKH
ncbi:MAG: hypothetical protein HQL56_04100 [Magnetococcales bacterium]|nr:hypothetical protein [Magnetococcales bacterium]